MLQMNDRMNTQYFQKDLYIFLLEVIFCQKYGFYDISDKKIKNVCKF